MRLNELLTYLETLAKVQGAGHYVNGEIKECVQAIREELGFKKDKFKESLRLVFEAKVKEKGFDKVTEKQYEVFEAYYSGKRTVEVFYRHEIDPEINVAVEVLKEFKTPEKRFEFESLGHVYAVLLVQRV